MFVIREKKTVVVAELGNALHFYEAGFVICTVGKKVMTISGAIAAIFNTFNQVFKARTQKALLLPFQSIFLSLPANFFSLLLHLLKIDTSMFFCPRFPYGRFNHPIRTHVDLVEIGHKLWLGPSTRCRITALGL